MKAQVQTVTPVKIVKVGWGRVVVEVAGKQATLHAGDVLDVTASLKWTHDNEPPSVQMRAS